MKCPSCGAWNQAYLPRCTRCGALLPKNVEKEKEDWEDAMHKKAPSLTIKTFSEKDTMADIPTPPKPETPYDPEDLTGKLIADEMEDLVARRRRGKERLQQIKDNAAQVRESMRRTEVVRPVPEEGDANYETDADVAPVTVTRTRTKEKDASSNARPVDSRGRVLVYADDPDAPIYYDGYEKENLNRSRIVVEDGPRRVDPRPQRMDAYANYQYQEQKKKHRTSVLLTIFIVILVLGGLSVGGILVARSFVLSQGMQVRNDTETNVLVTAGMTDDGHPCHTLTFTGRENATIYLRETQSSYVIANRNVSITIPDYMWYDTESSTYATAVDTDTMDVHITPYIRYTQEGDQYQLEPISYTIDVPLSPVRLINPPTAFLNVGVSIYEVRINVEQGSTVVIDGTNVSTLIRDTGNVSKNVQVLPVGENTISISVKTKYCRENKMEVVLYRAPQDIPLELSPTVIVEWNYEDGDPEHIARITGSTLPGAQITIETESHDLHIDNNTGEFSFVPVFRKLGNNDIIIRASAEGRQDSVITHTVYFMPTADVYTRKAWDLDSQYSDLITYINMRIGTIYVGTGVIERIISSTPQMAIMNIGSENFNKRVLLENSSKTTWELGTKYRIYGEAYGIYDTMPRLTVRYTYLME